MSVVNMSTPATSGQPIDLVSGDWNATGKSAMRSILVGTAGVIVGRLAHDTADVTYPAPAGVLPLRFIVIRKVGTTAANLVGLF